MNEETNIFDFIYPKYKISKKIKLIELFGGYGSQYLSLKYIGANVEHHKLVEWAAKSIQAYNDLHIQDYTDYSKNLTDDEVIDKIVEYGVSLDYNKPATREQIKRQKYRTIYNNIIATNNLVDISRVNGKDLEINDKDNYEYILCYSFPCQDLSSAGLGKGMSDTSTRSGLLWEVERILYECKSLNQLPQILLMEKVPQVHGSDNVKDFNKWQLSLEKLGYKNYWQDLMATDYGIPQTRNRCFMVSILGDYSYTFPNTMPLGLKLKDILEDKVDEKYYLSDKQIKDVQGWKAYQKPLETMKQIEKNGLSPTLTTRSGAYAAGMILVNQEYVGTYQYAKSDNFMQGKSRLQIGKDVSDTLQTSQKEGIVVLEEPKVIGGIGEKKSNGGTQWYQQDRVYDNKVGIIITTCSNPYYVDKKYRIRKLTPKEAFRLMGLKDEDIFKISKKQTDNSLYHLAGDSIVTNCLCAILSKLIGINWEEKFKPNEWWNNDSN